MKPEMILKRKQVKRLFKKWTNYISLFYFHGYPKVLFRYYDSHTHGSYNPYKNTIHINLTHPIEKIEKTIIHELCHSVNEVAFCHQGTDNHNTTFWRICKRFKLKPEDYGYGMTQTMRVAYNKKI